MAIRPLIFSLLTSFLAFTACADRDLPTRVAPAVAPTAQQVEELVLPSPATPPPSAPAVTPVPLPTPTPAPLRVAAARAVPAELVQVAQHLVETYPEQFAWSDGEEGAELWLNAAWEAGEGEPLARWLYAVAVPFPTVADATTAASLQASWLGQGPGQPLLTEQTAALLEQSWGAGAAPVVAAESLLPELWSRDNAWTLVPFHQLVPDLKVWQVDGETPLSPDFNRLAYPFALTVTVDGAPAAVAAFKARWPEEEIMDNYNPGNLTTVAMTGVTALVRATAYQMEIRSITYPGEEVASVMQAADIAHVSNEVAFVPDCPPPHYIGGVTFCSSPRYLGLLEMLGVDVVELTGNHVNDWGAGYIPYTLGRYEAAGMLTFGGGLNLEDARQPALFEHNGNRIAFLGCNPVGPAGAWASAEWGGARPCDNGFFTQIGELRDQGYVVIVTQQYREIYNYAPTMEQRDDFQALAAAGAAAVSGSQGHHAQGFAFYDGTFIHYGLGNLFFDQMDRLGTRQTFVDLYTIYDNRLLSVTLWTGLIENYARPRLMTPEERADLLETVFQASGW